MAKSKSLSTQYREWKNKRDERQQARQSTSNIVEEFAAWHEEQANKRRVISQTTDYAPRQRWASQPSPLMQGALDMANPLSKNYVDPFAQKASYDWYSQPESKRSDILSRYAQQAAFDTKYDGMSYADRAAALEELKRQLKGMSNPEQGAEYQYLRNNLAADYYSPSASRSRSEDYSKKVFGAQRDRETLKRENDEYLASTDEYNSYLNELGKDYSSSPFFDYKRMLDDAEERGLTEKADEIRGYLDRYRRSVAGTREGELIDAIMNYSAPEATVNEIDVLADENRAEAYRRGALSKFDEHNLSLYSDGDKRSIYTLALEGAGIASTGNEAEDRKRFEETLGEGKNFPMYISEQDRRNVEETLFKEYAHSADNANANYKQVTSEEKALYYALIAKGKNSEAAAYINSLRNDLYQRAKSADAKRRSDKIKEEGAFWGTIDAIGQTALSVPGSVLGGIPSALDFAGQIVSTGEYDPYLNPEMHVMQNEATASRQAVSDTLRDVTGGGLAPFLYNAGMSAVDSAVGAIIGNSLGGMVSTITDSPVAISLAENAYTFIMGSGAASSRAEELYLRGASNEQIIYGAITAGLIESLFEEFSLQNLMHPNKTWSVIRRILTQAGVEGSEELATDIANHIAGIGLDNNSDINTSIRELLANNPDMSYQDAQKEALKSAAGDTIESFLAGALSGGLSAGAYDASTGVQRNFINRSVGKNISSNYQAENTVKQGLEADENSEAYKLAKDIDERQRDGKKVSNKALGELARALDTELTEKSDNALEKAFEYRREAAAAETVENALKENGATEEEAADLAPLVSKSILGEELTDAEQTKIDNNTAAVRYMDEVGSKTSEISGETGLQQLALRVNATTRGTGSTKASDRLRESALDKVFETAMRNELKPAKLSDNEIGKANETSYKVSTAGKTTYNGKAVNIDAIDEIGDGNALVTLDNGETAKLSDIEFADKGEAVAWQTITSIDGITPKAASELIAQYENKPANVTAGVWARGIAEGYEIGRSGKLGTKEFPKAEASAKYLSNIGNDARRISETVGRQDARYEQHKEAIEVDRKNVNNKNVNDAADTLDKMGRKYKIVEGIDGDGYIEKDGTIVLNKDAKDPIGFVLKHELTHYAETSKDYDGFVKAVKGSRAFAAWIDKQSLKDGTQLQQEADYIRRLKDRYRRHGVTLTNTEAHREMIANFVGDTLFNENGVGLDGLVNGMNAADRNAVMRFLTKVADFFRKHFTKKGETAYLEHFFSQLQNTATGERADEKTYSIPQINEEGRVSPSPAQISVTNGLQSEYQTGNYLATERGEIKYSIAENDEYMSASLSRANKEDYSFINDLLKAKKVREAIADRMQQADIVDLLPPDETEKVWQTKSEKAKNTFVDDAAYGGSEESATECVRTMLTDELVNIVAEKLGRQPTVKEQIKLAQFMLELAATPECVYCYVAMDRKAFRNYLNSYVEQTDGIISNYDAGMSDEENYEAFRGGRADTSKMRARFNLVLNSYKQGVKITAKDLVGAVNSSEYMYNLKRNEDISAAKKKLIEDAIVYAQSASWAKKRRPYLAYNGHILKWSDARIEKLNKKYGLRFYSFSDYSPAFILENMQMMTDAAVRGLKGLAYTKELDFVRIFAPTGIGINISCFGSITDGKVIEDKVQGAAWEDAQKLREKHPNVGITFVATNDELIKWALAQDWIDVVIPFHLVRTGAKAAEYLGYTNYTHVSSDTKNAAWRDTSYKTIYPEQHHNDKETFLRLCKENGLNPRFSAWVDDPNYMKLVNETRQSTDETSPIRAVFDRQAALESLDKFVKDGGYYKHLGGNVKSLEAYADQAYEMLQSSEDDNKAFSIPETSEDVKRSDEKYLAAVNSGDMETAQRMVDEAAKKAGYTIKAYHGTNNGEFTVFDRERAGANYHGWGRLGKGFYFSQKESEAKTWGEKGSGKKQVNIIKAYLNLKNSINVFERAPQKLMDYIHETYAVPETWDKDGATEEYMSRAAYRVIDFLQNTRNADVRDVLQKLGYDGVYSEDGVEYVVYDSSQIKSADPVTYDDNGNVIPLSERFNESNEDIRWSIPETAEDQGEYTVSEIKKLNETVTHLKDMLKLQRTQTHGTVMTQASVARQADRLMDRWDVYVGKGELTKLLNTFYTTVAQKVNQRVLTWEEVADAAQPVVDYLLSKQVTETVNDSVKNVVDYLKGKAIRLNDQQRAEIKHVYGSVTAWQKAIAGTVKLRNDGIALDSLWQEASELHPDWFDPDVTSDADMPIRLAETAKQLQDSLWMEQELPDEAWQETKRDILYDVYETFFDAAPIQTLADKQAKEMSELRAKAYAKIEQVKDAASTRIQNLKEADRERYERLRRDKNAKIEEVKAEARERRQRERERRKKSQLRAEIKDRISEFNDKLLRPGKNKYVPMEFVRSVAGFLKDIDIGAKPGTKVSEKLAALKVKYDALKNDKYYSAAYNEQIGNLLQTVATEIGDTPLPKMSAYQLELLNNMLRALNHRIERAVSVDRISKSKNAFEYARELINELNAVDRRAITGTTAGKLLDMQVRPQTMFERFAGFKKNSYWSQLYDALDAAQLRETQLSMEAQQMFTDLLNDRKNYKKLADSVDIGLTDEEGNPVLISRGMMLSIRRALMNADNTRHIVGGGFTVPDFDLYYKGKTGDAFNKKGKRVFGFAADMADIAHQIGELRETMAEQEAAGESTAETETKIADLESQFNELKDRSNAYAAQLAATIDDQLTMYEQNLLSMADVFFDEWSKDILNEATLAVYGFKKANVEKYFPIKVDNNYTETKFDTFSNDISLENAGFMKDRVMSSKPILLQDITDVISDQIKKVSRYAAYLEVLDDFKRIYNVTLPGSSDSVQDALGKRFAGEEGKKFIENLLQDIQGGRRGGSVTLFDKARGKLAAATLTLNARVALAQAASFPTAAAELGWAPIMKALGKTFKKTDKELIMKYSPLLAYRSWGFSSTEIGDARRIKDIRHNVDSKLRWLTGWITSVDSYTVGHLWYAAEYYVDANNKDLEKGSEKYYEEVAKVFNRTIEKTQPNYTTLQRPELMRTDNALVKQLSMFMTQRLQNVNILYEAFARYDKYKKDFKAGKNGVTREDVIEARKARTRAIESQIIAAATISIIKNLTDMLLHNFKKRDDDDDYDLTDAEWNLLDAFCDSLISNVVLGSEAYSFLKSKITGDRYYGISLGGVGAITETVDDVSDFIDATKKAFAGNDMNWNAAKQLGYSMSRLMGIPVQNAVKYVTAVSEWVQDAKADQFNHGNYVGKVGVRLYLAEGRTSEAIKEINEQQAKGVDMQSTIRDYYKPMYLEAKKSGNKSLMSDIGKELDKIIKETGVYKKSADKVLAGWVTQAENDAKEKSK